MTLIWAPLEGEGAIWAPKKRDFQAPPVAPHQSHYVQALYKTGTLVILCTEVSVFSFLYSVFCTFYSVF
jgi:hypothetical protein